MSIRSASSRTDARRLAVLARTLVAFVAALLCAVSGAAVAADFTKPFAGVKPVRGTLPVLVVLLRANDPADAPTRTATDIRNFFFGPRKSVSTYFNEVSYGTFNIKEAMVTDWLVARDDTDTPGIDESSNAWVHAGADEATLRRKGAWLIRQIEEMTPFRFKPYDRNGDGKVTIDELAVIWIYAGVSGRGRETDPAVVKVDSLSQGVQMGLLARTGDQSPWITSAHEMGHQILKLFDLYVDNKGYPGVGAGSLMCDDQSDGTHLDPWAKMKLGWLKPTVVTEDGWYDLADVESVPQALILHDPARGAQDYFIVENRWPGQSHEDFLETKGIAVWRVSERDGSGDWARKAIDLVWAGGLPPSNQINPGYCPIRADAFFDGGNPATAYGPTWNSAPGKLVWRDGTPSAISIWHIPPASPLARVYVDIPPRQSPALASQEVAIVGSSADLDRYASPYNFLLPGGNRLPDVVGIGIASDNHVYAWYRNGTVSSGTSADLDDFRAPYPYAIPGGRTPNDIIAIDIASDDHVYAWYRDGTVSAGTTRDLAAYRPPDRYTLAPGRSPEDVVGIGIASDDHVYVWYRDGMVSSGTSRDLDAYRPVYRYSLPLGWAPNDIQDVAIDTSDRIYSWLRTWGAGAPTVVSAYIDGGAAVGLGKSARLLVKTTDGFGRPLANVGVTVSATAGALTSPTRIVTDEVGLAVFSWRAPGSAPSAYDGRALLEIRASQQGRADGRGVVDVQILGGAIQ